MLRVLFAAVRLFLLVNPAASSVTTRGRVAIEGILRASHDVSVANTSRRDHATELAHDAARDGYEVVVVLGGDGTLNEAADGLAGSHTALAALPGGSTNVFARTVGVVYDPVEAASQLVDALERGSTRRIGLGRAHAPGREPRRFVFHLGVGFDAAVIRRMEERSYLKRHFAHPAFAVASMATWLRHYDRNLPIRLVVTGTEEPGGRPFEVSTEGPYAVVSNSDPYTYVGRRRMTISPDASLDDALAVTVLRNLHACLVFRAAGSSMAKGRFVTESPDIVQVGGATAVTIACERPFPWQVDGDYLGDVERLDVSFEPDALTLVVP